MFDQLTQGCRCPECRELARLDAEARGHFWQRVRETVPQLKCRDCGKEMAELPAIFNQPYDTKRDQHFDHPDPWDSPDYKSLSTRARRNVRYNNAPTRARVVDEYRKGINFIDEVVIWARIWPGVPKNQEIGTETMSRRAKSVLYWHAIDTTDDYRRLRSLVIRTKNCGRKTIAELDAWAGVAKVSADRLTALEIRASGSMGKPVFGFASCDEILELVRVYRGRYPDG